MFSACLFLGQCTFIEDCFSVLNSVVYFPFYSAFILSFRTIIQILILHNKVKTNPCMFGSMTVSKNLKYFIVFSRLCTVTKLNADDYSRHIYILRYSNCLPLKFWLPVWAPTTLVQTGSTRFVHFPLKTIKNLNFQASIVRTF